MTKSQEKWWYQHGRGKYPYRSRGQAWRACARIWARERRIDSLVPYECRWTRDWRAGRTGTLHWHIGHGKFTPRQRAARKFRRLVVYPYYRCRSKARRAVKRARAGDGILTRMAGLACPPPASAISATPAPEPEPGFEPGAFALPWRRSAK
jgi:hypothetical protein